LIIKLNKAAVLITFAVQTRKQLAQLLPLTLIGQCLHSHMIIVSKVIKKKNMEYTNIFSLRVNLDFYLLPDLKLHSLNLYELTNWHHWESTDVASR
jgi:hypothetical protein